MKATETTRTLTGTTATSQAALTTSEKIDGTIIASFFASGAIVGLWSFASLIGGLTAAGSPLALAKGYFQALSGL